ncbi:PREDICTED: transcriptional regulator ATRX homolog, partial [Rhagoletis zephyria]|uniref:transcriptional regulator ATRX homolog n=1 Tax=Rhagoletis zephyria TaxID=28612 RepID=UPI000811A60C
MGHEKANSDSDANSAEENQLNDTKNGSSSDGNDKSNCSENNDSASNSKTVNKTTLCVQKTTTEFKLRVVPLEKLLEKPLVDKNNERTSTLSDAQTRRLPKRKNRSNCVVIDLTDSEESEEEEEIVKSVSKTKKSVPSKSEASAQPSKSNPPVKLRELPRLRQCTVRIKRTPFPLTDSLLAERVAGSKVNGGDTSIKTQDKRDRRNSNNNSYLKNKPSASFRKKVMTSDSSESESTNQKNDTVLDGENSEETDVKSSDSEVIPARKKRVFYKRKKSSDDDSDFAPQPAAKKRGRIRRGQDSSDNDDVVKRKGRGKKNANSDEDDDDDSDEKNKNKRKHIRKIIKTKDLDISTKNAAKEEEERRKRIEERQKLYNQIYEKPENVEVTDLVLDFDEETKKPLLQVDKGILKKLKPHQVSGVKFMWDACFETIKEAEDNAGSGCILAHCMGLGKTLQIVTLSHTLLVNSRRTGVERVLIITPLSTLNNWAREFKHWIGFANKRNVEVYDMSKYKDKPTRIFKLNEWFEEGGACVIGYDMYRILANEKAKGLRKKQREALQQSLVDPGPDLVVCDEGHLLKNEKTSISKAVTKMRTKRRIVLTGTPLQNNLKEFIGNNSGKVFNCTKNAAKEEEERRKRIEERQKLYNQIYEKPENVEVTDLVLDFDEETKKPLLQVDKGILKKLKPHQVSGVKFMWDACFETIKEAEDNAGSGCILAHCMGLGKTLQIVTLSHTLLVNSRRTGVERVLIITPLSTLNNWAREFKHWIGFANKRNVEVYDMSKYKDKPTRIFKLNEWFEEGGACVIGYDMYRILANEKAKGLRKKQREALQQSLVDPGPDLVVCDEGHLLKNEKTSISKAVTKMRTKRRIVLTGTPLQNNLKE